MKRTFVDDSVIQCRERIDAAIGSFGIVPVLRGLLLVVENILERWEGGRYVNPEVAAAWKEIREALDSLTQSEKINALYLSH